MKIEFLKKYAPEFLYRDQLILISLGGGFVTNIILWILLLIKFGFSSDPSPLHFNVVYGINYVGPAYQVYQLPLIGLIILFVNWFLMKLVWRDAQMFSYILGFTALFVQILLLLSGISLTLLNR